MTHADKELLLIDLCARLPYGVKGQYMESEDELLRAVIINYHSLHPKSHPTGEGMVMCGDLKPWLFPLSSMTEEQNLEYLRTCKGGNAGVPTLASFDWLNKNHFDYRGLIEKGLALDATGLNIY